MTNGGLHTSGGIVANVHVKMGGRYFYCRGAAPDGTPRLARLSKPPHGKTVYAYDDTTGEWTVERLPFRLQPGAIVFLVLAGLALLLIPLALSGQDPILAKFFTPVAVGVLLLIAFLAQTAHLMPHDAISAAEAQQAAYEAYLESQRIGAERAAHQQARAMASMQQWQAATWGQLAQINAAMHPGQDTYRPYGQSPPL